MLTCLRLAIAPAVAFAALIAVASMSAPLAAGIDNVPLPAVLTHPLQPQEAVQLVAMPPLNLEAIEIEDRVRGMEGEPPRYAIPNAVNITPDTHGTWEKVDDVHAVWRLRVTSPGCVSLNFGFTRFAMPEGGRLFVYSADMRMQIRPFTAADNEAHGQLWTPPVVGDEAVIEVMLPAELRDKLVLTLGSINVGYKEFAIPTHLRSNAQQDKGDEGGIASGACNVDVICPEGDPWRDQIPGVAVISTGGSTFCTGFMVNNTAADRTNFFMTANHCGVDAGDAASLVAFWNYENSTCRPVGSGASGGPGDGSLDEFNTGSFWRASYSPSDMTLVELDDDPDPEWTVSYLGWERQPVNPPSGACIHHPNTDEKRITFYDIAVRPDRPTHGSSWPCSPFPGPGDNSHVTAYWSLGVTEPGSSGSPLFDNNRRVIGQLHGGPSSCGQSGDGLSDCYGRITLSWTGGGTNSSRLSNWLDPGDTGATSVDTITTRGISVSPAGAVTHIGVVGGPFSPASTTYTLSNSTVNSANYTVSFVAGGTAPLLINGGTSSVSGSLAAGGSTTITIAPAGSANSLPAGVYTTNVLFQDTTNNVANARAHIIEVGQTGYTTTPATGLVSGGPVGGPFTATQTYTLTSTRPTPVTVVVTASEPWISINGGSGPVNIPLNGTGATANVTIGFSSAANALANGLYNGTVTFNASSGGTGSNTSRQVSLDVGRYTYVATGMPILINDNSTFFSTINVTDAYCVGDVDLPIDITHTYIGDLIIEITNPSGVTVRLHDRTGGDADNIVTTWDDEGDAPDGPGSLSDFDDRPVTGTWTLRVSDEAGIDVGSLNGWSLKIAASPNLCPPIANPVAVALPAQATSAIALDGIGVNPAPLNHIIESLPANGSLFDPGAGAIVAVPYTLVGHGSVVNYRPFGAYLGADAFDYRVHDGLPSDLAMVDVTVGVHRVALDFPLNVNPGWTTTPDWAFGQPAGAAGDPSSGFTGPNVYGYNLAGAYGNNISPPRYLTTTPLNLAGRSGTQLTFKRWLGIESAAWDHARVQVSADNTNWVTVWEHTQTDTALNETSWSTQSYDISATADNDSSVWIRWGMGTTDGSVTYGGWNIDDIQILALAPPCPGDINADAAVDVDDLIAIILGWGACTGCVEDVNFDNQVGVDDLIAVILGWGACP